MENVEEEEASVERGKPIKTKKLKVKKQKDGQTEGSKKSKACILLWFHFNWFYFLTLNKIFYEKWLWGGWYSLEVTVFVVNMVIFTIFHDHFTISKYPKKEIVFLWDLRCCRVGFKTEKTAVYKVTVGLIPFIFSVTTNIQVRFQFW